MKPQEKMSWFWATGVLPGTLFDDIDDKKARVTWRERRTRVDADRRHSGRHNR
jgi:hypothetical protein